MDITLDEAASDASKVLTVLGPLLAIGPGVSVGLALAMKVAQGLLAAEPVAVALYRQLVDGTEPTATQLAEYAANYEASYTQLNADINAKLAALPLD